MKPIFSTQNDKISAVIMLIVSAVLLSGTIVLLAIDASFVFGYLLFVVVAAGFMPGIFVAVLDCQPSDILEYRNA